jgi:hypothetical protein
LVHERAIQRGEYPNPLPIHSRRALGNFFFFQMEETSILKYLPTYGVLLCTICTEPHCLPPGSVGQHLRGCHRAILNTKQRASLVKYADSLKDELKRPGEVEPPARELGPVEGLHVMKGFECLRCGYVCGSEDTMSEQHCRPEHGWNWGKPTMWKKQHIQVCRHFPFMSLLS